MKTLIIAIICIAAGFGAAWLIAPQSASTQMASSSDSPKQLYTCGMHPEIVSEEPGICPICNMKLTPKRDNDTESGSVRVDPTTRQSMGLVTVPASYRTMTRSINTFGKIETPDPNVHAITLKIDGWVERLFVSEEGERVFKGKPLLEIYSPALVAAQEELLIALESGTTSQTMQRLAESAERRLRNWDVPESVIDNLKETRLTTRTITLRSPANGFVKSKMVNSGDRVSARSTLYEIVDLSAVWVEAFVYEQDLPFLQVGQAGSVAVAGIPGKQYRGEITYVSPLLDRRGQAEIRLALDNPDFNLKPEMYAEVNVEVTTSDQRLAIPRSAVINSGVRQLVYVTDSDDTYQPKQVVTGVVDDHDMVEVSDGLLAGDNVVVSGQFLIDSEARLNESSSGGMGGHQHGQSMQNDDSSEMEMGHEGATGHDHASHADSDDPYDIHTCPMPSHFDVLHYGPGQCPKCNMDLVPIGETEHEPVYVCPMPEDKVVSEEPGNCPKCNMKLVEYEPKEDASATEPSGKSEMSEHHDHETHTGASTQPADDPYDIHTCPMPSHFHVLNYGPGACPECNMDLVPVSETDNKPVYVCPMPQCGIAQKEPGLCPKCNMHLTEYQPGDDDAE